MKKKFHPALFSPPGWWTGNDFLFKGGLCLRTQGHWQAYNYNVPTYGAGTQ